MTFITPKPLVVMMITAMLTACGGSDWQTGIPGSGGTGDGNTPTGTPITKMTISGTVEAVTITTVKINSIEYKITPQTKYLNSQTIQMGTSATVVVNPTTQEVVSIDQNSPNTSQELTPLHELTTLMGNGDFYQINTARSYTKIASPTADNLNDYHWLQTQYQFIYGIYPKSSSWEEVIDNNKTLLSSGEWSLVNDKKLMLHYQENYAETIPNQPLMGKYSVNGLPIDLTLQGYPSGATAFNMQYTPYQDEYSIDPSAYSLSQTNLEEIIGSDTNYIHYGENKEYTKPSIVFTLSGNSNASQGKVQFYTEIICPTSTNPELNTCSNATSGIVPYLETGTWKRINIAGNDIIKITPPASIKDSLIEADKADKILVKQANSTENVKIGKFYPANQPVKMTWYNQTAMDYILQQGLSTVVYK